MKNLVPQDWKPWRDPSPLGGHRPTKSDLLQAKSSQLGRQDVLPYPDDGQCKDRLRLLFVGVNPSPWTAAVNAPFAHPGNRFWKALHASGITNKVVDASRGLEQQDERLLAELGIGITNLVDRPTARADEIASEELRAGASRLVQRVILFKPRAVAVVGITAFRDAFMLPKATLGPQNTSSIKEWPQGVLLWVLPHPSGLNAHENIESLGQKWKAAWEASRA
ncbi:MAG TPA: mismatch-specific DNA-glycosylase [Candidatus Yaniella excrementigallinarum]|nr:mismatch-specific DNA-glycosylase [Candidatus Yaniella excrementigallinarum]